MSLLIEGMKLPKRTKIKTGKWALAVWNVKNELSGKIEQVTEGRFRCELVLKADGTAELSAFGKVFPVIPLSSTFGTLDIM